MGRGVDVAQAIGMDPPEDEEAWDSSRVVNTPTERGQVRFALAIPTAADWMPERAASLAKLQDMLGSRPQFYREFRDKAPNWVWSRQLWEWGAAMAKEGATHLVQLQDDVRPMPHFWSVLRAMVEANPEKWIGLQVNHPNARQLAHNGRRWYRDRWLVGCQYVAPLQGPHSLATFGCWLAVSETLPEGHPQKPTQFECEHEDVTIAAWHHRTDRDVWHPIPAIADVDLTIGSTYETTPGHIDDHRRPTVTWHGFPLAMLQSPSYWEVPAQVERLQGPGPGPCSSCGKAEAKVVYPGNFLRLCAICWLAGQGSIVGVNLKVPS